MLCFCRLCLPIAQRKPTKASPGNTIEMRLLVRKIGIALEMLDSQISKYGHVSLYLIDFSLN